MTLSKAKRKEIGARRPRNPSTNQAARIQSLKRVGDASETFVRRKGLERLARGPSEI
jgi:hypothetical protein